MPISLSDHSRGLLSQSLPLVEHRKDELIDRISSHLRASDSQRAGNSEMVAMMLVELLIAHVNHLVRSRPAAHSPETRSEHDALGIFGRHYSLFGGALMPALDDLLGPNVPRSVTSAWCDAFWSLIQDVQTDHSELLDA